MEEGEKLAFYSKQLITAIEGHPENTPWKDGLTAQAYWEQVRMAREWCSGYAVGLITRLQARSNNLELSIEDIGNCETLEQLKSTLAI